LKSNPKLTTYALAFGKKGYWIRSVIPNLVNEM